jgi:hypothetical protein
VHGMETVEIVNVEQDTVARQRGKKGDKTYMGRTCSNCYWSRSEGFRPYKVWCLINHIMTVANKNRCKCNSYKRSIEGR